MNSKERISEKYLHKLTPEQQSSIETSRNQIQNNKSHKNDDVISEMREWLLSPIFIRKNNNQSRK